MGKPGSKGGFKQDMRSAGLVVFIGSLIIAASAAGYFIGSFLDRQFNTVPWLVIVFVGLGVAGGFIQAYRIGRRFFRN